MFRIVINASEICGLIFFGVCLLIIAGLVIYFKICDFVEQIKK